MISYRPLFHADPMAGWCKSESVQPVVPTSKALGWATLALADKKMADIVRHHNAPLKGDRG